MFVLRPVSKLTPPALHPKMSFLNANHEVQPGFTPALSFREPGLNLAGCLIQSLQPTAEAGRG